MLEGKFGWLYILDYSTSTINEIELTKEDLQKDNDSIVEYYGFKLSQCNYMFTENKCVINTIIG